MSSAKMAAILSKGRWVKPCQYRGPRVYNAGPPAAYDFTRCNNVIFLSAANLSSARSSNHLLTSIYKYMYIQEMYIRLMHCLLCVMFFYSTHIFHDNFTDGVNPQEYMGKIKHESTWKLLCNHNKTNHNHYSDVIMSAMAPHFTGVSIAYSSVCSGADQRKHKSSASLAFMRREFHRWPVNSPHKGPVTRKLVPFDDVIMTKLCAYFMEPTEGGHISQSMYPRYSPAPDNVLSSQEATNESSAWHSHKLETK